VVKKAIKYTIFKTRWGYFGLAGTEYGLLRTHLPLAEFNKVKSQILKNLPTARFDKSLFSKLQQLINDYFEGTPVDFGRDIPIVLDGFSQFRGLVLTACRDIRFGQTISYGRLARKIGQPDTYRAVGSALAKNPLPLIIPCHRVVRSDGKIGGFSATGGKELKEKLLHHEQKLSR